MLYSTKGSVFVTGDFNSRTGTKSDYVDKLMVDLTMSLILLKSH